MSKEIDLRVSESLYKKLLLRVKASDRFESINEFLNYKLEKIL